jgi:hypothetical protein
LGPLRNIGLILKVKWRLAVRLLIIKADTLNVFQPIQDSFAVGGVLEFKNYGLRRKADFIWKSLFPVFKDSAENILSNDALHALLSSASQEVKNSDGC